MISQVTYFFTNASLMKGKKKKRFSECLATFSQYHSIGPNKRKIRSPCRIFIKLKLELIEITLNFNSYKFKSNLNAYTKLSVRIIDKTMNIRIVWKSSMLYPARRKGSKSALDVPLVRLLTFWHWSNSANWDSMVM